MLSVCPVGLADDSHKLAQALLLQPLPLSLAQVKRDLRPPLAQRVPSQILKDVKRRSIGRASEDVLLGIGVGGRGRRERGKVDFGRDEVSRVRPKAELTDEVFRRERVGIEFKVGRSGLGDRTEITGARGKGEL